MLVKVYIYLSSACVIIHDFDCRARAELIGREIHVIRHRSGPGSDDRFAFFATFFFTFGP
jgi:hypothetical protein